MLTIIPCLVATLCPAFVSCIDAEGVAGMTQDKDKIRIDWDDLNKQAERPRPDNTGPSPRQGQPATTPQYYGNGPSSAKDRAPVPASFTPQVHSRGPWAKVLAVCVALAAVAVAALYGISSLRPNYAGWWIPPAQGTQVDVIIHKGAFPTTGFFIFHTGSLDMEYEIQWHETPDGLVAVAPNDSPKDPQKRLATVRLNGSALEGNINMPASFPTTQKQFTLSGYHKKPAK